jgi:ribonuclease P protein component
VKRIYSLKGRKLIREVYHKGRKLQDAGIRVFYLNCGIDNHVKSERRKNVSAERNIKIAVILAKSFGKAHERNRAKRRIRAICSEIINEMRNGFYIIIKIGTDFQKLQFEEEKSVIRSVFIKAGLLHRDVDTTVR